MKRIFLLVLALMLAAVCVGSAGADATNIWVLNTVPNEPVGTMDVYLQAMDANNAYVVLDQNKLTVRIDNDYIGKTEKIARDVGISYIFVVDCSCCYKEASNDYVSAALSTFASGMRSQDNAFFVTINNKTVDTKGYLTAEQARSYIGSLDFMFKKSAKRDDIVAPLWDGIEKATAQAAQTNSAAKPVKVIVIFTDGVDDGKSKTVDSVVASLGNCPGTPVYSFVAVGARDSGDTWIAETASGVRDGLQRLKDLTRGNYYAVNSTDAGTTYAGLALKEIQSIMCATVSLVGLAPGNEGDFPMDVIYDGSDRSVSVSSTVHINRGALPTPTPEPVTRDPNVKFTWEELTAQIADLATIQTELKAKYYLENVTGVMDEETKLAILTFCDVNRCMKTNEGISIEAWNAITSGRAMAQTTATPEPEATRNPDIILSVSDGFENSPQIISNVQDELYRLYYLSPDEYNAEYGQIGQATLRAINSFCKDNKFNNEEGLPRSAYDFLMGGSAQPRATETPAPIVTDSPTPAPTMAAGLKLQLGNPVNQPGTIIQVQERLKALGYLEEGKYTKGEYDATTHAAVLSFCGKNGEAPSTDGLTVSAYNLLISDAATPAVEITPPPTAAPTAHPFMPGNEEPDSFIHEYQMRLESMGYYEGKSFRQGVFDEATQAAQDRFCEVMNIEKEEGASVLLQQAVMGGAAKPNEERPLLDKVRIALTGDTEIAGMSIPTWALVAGVAVLVIIAVIVIIILAKSAKKKKNADGGETSYGGYSFSGTGAGDYAAPIEYGSNEETVDMAENGADLPTTVDGNSQNITLRIDYNGTSIDKAYELSEGLPLVIGRGTDADIPTNKDDMRVSRRHGEFCYRNGSVYFRDTSRTGTIVDGQMVHESEVQINSGTTIHISSHVIKVQM